MSERRRLRPAWAAIPIVRLMSMLIMLAVIGLTIYKFCPRQPDVAPAQQAAEPQDAGPAKKPDAKDAEKPAAPKIVNPMAAEDPQEWKTFLHDSGAIVDRTTSIWRCENPVYFRVLGWVESQPLAQMKQRCVGEVSFHNLLTYPNKFRGQPLHVELNVERVLPMDVEISGKGTKKRLYEIWGKPASLDGWLYVVVTPELPPGFPIGATVDARASVYGYFFKLQGYEPFDAKPNARPLLAPLIVGRIAPAAAVAASPLANEDKLLGPMKRFLSLGGLVLIVGGLALAAVIISWIVAGRRRPIARAKSTVAWPDAIDADAIDHDDVYTAGEVQHD